MHHGGWSSQDQDQSIDSIEDGFSNIVINFLRTNAYFFGCTVLLSGREGKLQIADGVSLSTRGPQIPSVAFPQK